MANSRSHGLLLVDKPSGWTSHDLVNWARRTLQTRSVGHCGTLDPMATGLMVLLIGEATKLSNYILEKDKAYQVRLELGMTTDTLDTTGKVLSTAPSINLTNEKIQEVAFALQGELQLPVPMYSAVKIGGVKLLEHARLGQKIEQPMKTMKFWDLQIQELGNKYIQLHVHCSKGSYIRAWVHEFGQRLGCGAAMCGLVRTASYPYVLAQAHSVADLEQKASCDSDKVAGEMAPDLAPELAAALLDITQALPEYRVLYVQAQDEGMLLNGQISSGLKSQLISLFSPEKKQYKAISLTSRKLLALIELDDLKGFIIKRGFRY